jgi:hypothetical protein
MFPVHGSATQIAELGPLHHKLHPIPRLSYLEPRPVTKFNWLYAAQVLKQLPDTTGMES